MNQGIHARSMIRVDRHAQAGAYLQQLTGNDHRKGLRFDHIAADQLYFFLQFQTG
ncbi:hypothetical protein D3C84_1201820 [compost metagenome]